MGKISHTTSKHEDSINFENFHEVLRGYTAIFTENVYPNRDFTYKKSKNAIISHKLKVVAGDKG